MTIWQIEQQQREKLLGWLIKEQNFPQDPANRICNNVFLNFRKQYRQKSLVKEARIWEAIHKLAVVELRKTQQLMNKNFGLSESAFQEMVLGLQKGDEKLFEEVFLQHFQDCMNYLKRQYNASHENAYDTCMNTLVEFRKRLIAGKVSYGNLRFLFTQMAGQIYLKWIKKEKLKDPILGMDFIQIEEVVTKEDLSILNKSWDGLCNNCQQLLKNFYYEDIPLSRLAETMGKSAVAVRKQKQRCIEKLRNLFIQNS